jgi:cation transport regulator
MAQKLQEEWKGVMPYRSTADLPPNVRKVLPLHAQEIYLAAFNNAWKEYADPFKRHDKASREEVARRVAWAAIKSKYEKQGDLWVAQSGAHPMSGIVSAHRRT